ncbi:deoxynucleoside kinase [Mesoplasma coleopterae]|uniref:Deoxyguanosine kinase n=1 Tax=Mesoplasma coleopterae TaxID=324078 RepID=A0A2K8P325_9MOLU|nr:deoxynucleoside kinase [Mesoplasma coleopterae]ATZ21086.1 deoxyguanosine kinase [Mesoplasma coleopterae]
MRIAIFGTTGAGKTTLAKALSKTLNYDLILEPIHKNPYFDDFYKDVSQNAFKMQIFMLTLRAEQMYETKNQDNIIFDRTIIEDPIFMKLKNQNGLITDLDFATYLSFFNNVILETMANSSNKINFDLVIYLKASNEVCLKRIHERARETELKIDNEFWMNLNSLYEKQYQEYKDKLPFIVIDANNDSLEAKVNEILKEIERLKE